MTPLEAWLNRWGGAAAGAGAGLESATAAFRHFASEYARLAAQPGVAEADWQALAGTFTAALLPGWPVGIAPEAAAGGLRALARISAGTATGFAERLQREPRPSTLRAVFDAWVDAAEAAYRSVALDADFTTAQAALCNEWVRLRGSQQGWVDEAARLAGLPDRREVDALHDTVRELRRALEARGTTPQPTRRRDAGTAPRTSPSRPKAMSKPKPKPKPPSAASPTVSAARRPRRRTAR